MNLEDIFGQTKEPSGLEKVCTAIDKGEADKLDEALLREFIVQLLAPLRHRFDEILDKPFSAELLAGRVVYMSPEQLNAVDTANCDVMTCEDIIGQAVARHTGFNSEYHRFSLARGCACALLASERRLHDAAKGYLAEKGDRSALWLHDAIGVGVVVWDGGKSFRALPLRQAADAARQGLLRFHAGEVRGGKNATDGFEVTVGDDEPRKVGFQ